MDKKLLLVCGEVGGGSKGRLIKGLSLDYELGLLQLIHVVWVNDTSKSNSSPQVLPKKILGPLSLDLGGHTNTPTATGCILYPFH